MQDEDLFKSVFNFKNQNLDENENENDTLENEYANEMFVTKKMHPIHNKNWLYLHQCRMK